MKRTLWILLLGASFACLGIWVYERLVEGFYKSAIHLQTWPKTEYDTLKCQYSVRKARKIVDQPFTYLGKGRQFFVFASSDGNYVLKFIKCQRVDVSAFYKNMPLPEFLDQKRQMVLEAKHERIEGILASIALAAGPLAQNTGVVFAHLTTKPQIEKKVLLIDKLGFEHAVELDGVPFVLQRKAVGIIPTFSELLSAQKYKQALKRFGQLVALIVSDAKAGVVDKDSGTIVRDNVAFLADRAIHVDIGTFELRENTLSRANLEEQLSHLVPLIEWIAIKNPQLAAECEAKIERAIEQNAKAVKS